jgi:hypothetical protein
LDLTSFCRRRPLSSIRDWMDTGVKRDRFKIVATEMRGTKHAEFANLISVPTLIPMTHAHDGQTLDYLGTRRRQTLFGLWHLVNPPLSQLAPHVPLICIPLRPHDSKVKFGLRPLRSQLIYLVLL